MKTFKEHPHPEMRLVNLLDGAGAAGAGSAVLISTGLRLLGPIPIQVFGTTIASASASSVGGADDLTSGGTYACATASTLIVQIDGSGTPDTIRWKKAGAASWVTEGYEITAAQAIDIGHGVTATFASSNGHNIDDYWSIVCSLAYVGKVTLQGAIATAGQITKDTARFVDITDAAWASSVNETKSVDLPYSYIRGNVSGYTSGKIFMKTLV